MTQPTTLGGRYEIGDVLGRGGMAEVHVGRDVRLGRTVAVKMLRVDLARDPSFQARFRREAQSAASLNHPSVVAVYDTGEGEIAGNALPYIVMEYVDGSTLRELLNSGRRLVPERALEITSGVLEALDYSHRHGIVHRDIKPANVMLTQSGAVKVMDFGIARSTLDESQSMTQTSAVVGTAQYLSPEQARGESVDARTDLYSTGCLMYELLTGRPPFVGDSPVAVAYQHVREQPLPPSSIDPDIPSAVDAIVLKALTKDRTARYQTAAEMRADIERALAGSPVQAPTVAPATQVFAPVPAAAATTSVVMVSDEPAPEPRRRTGAYLLLTLAVLAVLGLGAFAATQLLGDEDTVRVTVPDVRGLTQAEATARIEGDRLVVGDVTQAFSADVESGRVIASTPTAGTQADERSSVALQVSQGQEAVTVPALTDLTQQEAQAKLEEVGLVLGKVDSKPSNEPDGQVLESDPGAGTQVPAGSAVNIAVANGTAEIPEGIVGSSVGEARSVLQTIGFMVDVREQVTDEADPDTVLEVQPGEGAEAGLGTTVRLIVAVAPEPEPTPTPTPEPTPSAPAPSGAPDVPVDPSQPAPSIPPPAG